MLDFAAAFLNNCDRISNVLFVKWENLQAKENKKICKVLPVKSDVSYHDMKGLLVRPFHAEKLQLSH